MVNIITGKSSLAVLEITKLFVRLISFEISCDVKSKALMTC